MEKLKRQYTNLAEKSANIIEGLKYEFTQYALQPLGIVVEVLPYSDEPQKTKLVFYNGQYIIKDGVKRAIFNQITISTDEVERIALKPSDFIVVDYNTNTIHPYSSFEDVQEDIRKFHSQKPYPVSPVVKK